MNRNCFVIISPMYIVEMIKTCHIEKICVMYNGLCALVKTRDMNLSVMNAYFKILNNLIS